MVSVAFQALVSVQALLKRKMLLKMQIKAMIFRCHYVTNRISQSQGPLKAFSVPMVRRVTPNIIVSWLTVLSLGQLVCIFRSLPRVVKNNLQDLSATPAVPSRESDGVPRLFRSPSQLADAVRRLATAAHDHSYDFLDSRDPEDTEDVLRVMNNLLAFTHSKTSNFEKEKAEDVNQTNFSLLPTRTTVVHIKNRSYVVGAHKALAGQYSFAAGTPYISCIENISIARRHYRTDHERFFNSLSTILKDTMKKTTDISSRSLAWLSHHTRSMISVL